MMRIVAAPRRGTMSSEPSLGSSAADTASEKSMIVEMRTYTLQPGTVGQFEEAGPAPTRRSLRDPPLYPEARRHPRRHRSLEHGDRRPREALAVGLRWALGIRRPQPLVPHLGVQGRGRALRGPRKGPQGRY